MQNDGDRKRAHGGDGMAEATLYHQQQELFVLVAARLAAVQAGRARVRGEDGLPLDDPSTRAELLLLSPSFLVPCLTHDGQGLGHAGDRRIPERDQARGRPAAGRSGGARPLPRDLRRDAFGLRQPALGAADEPQGASIRASRSGPAPRPISTASLAIWRECLDDLGGPYLFGKQPTMADAMYAPVCTRFLTYDVKLDPAATAYCRRIMALPYMLEWAEAAKAESDEVEELDVEF